MLIIKESVEPGRQSADVEPDQTDPSDASNTEQQQQQEEEERAQAAAEDQYPGRDDGTSSSRVSLNITLPPRSRYPSSSEPTDPPMLNPLGSRRPSMVDPIEIMNAIRLEVQQQLMNHFDDDSNSPAATLSKIPFSQQNEQETNSTENGNEIQNKHENVVQETKKKLSIPRVPIAQNQHESIESKHSNSNPINKSGSNKVPDQIMHADSNNSLKSDVQGMPSDESFVSVSSHSAPAGRKPVSSRSPRPPPKPSIKSNVLLKRKSAKAARHSSS